MSERSASIADLAARLDHIDRALGEIQDMLMSGGSAGTELGLTAGPFASNEAVRRFERALGQMPEVTAVTLTGYDGGTRAVFDVWLS
jgi:hypothetical protein